MSKNKIVVLDKHIAYLGEMSGIKEGYELFLDEEFIEMVLRQHKEAYLYLTKKYGKGN